MTLDSLTEDIRRRMLRTPPLGYRVKFELAEGGTILLDGMATPAAVSNAEGPADTTIRIAAADLARLLSGELDPTLAYMTGRLKVEGSLGVALKLNSLFSD